MGRAVAVAHRHGAAGVGGSEYLSPGTVSQDNSAQNHGPWHRKQKENIN